MARIKTVRRLHLACSLIYVIAFPIGALAIVWSWHHWIPATVITLLAVLFWPLFLYDAFKRPESEPTFTGRIDHPGGGIGVVIAIVIACSFQLRGHGGWAATSLVLLIPILGIVFSLLSELVTCVIQKWIWEKSDSVVELGTKSGESLVLSFCPPAWNDKHVHFQLLGPTPIDLGNLHMKHFETHFKPWVLDRDSLRASSTIDDLAVVGIGVFGPLQYVCYGALPPHPYVVFIRDEKNAPTHTVARLKLDSATIADWRRALLRRSGQKLGDTSS